MILGAVPVLIRIGYYQGALFFPRFLFYLPMPPGGTILKSTRFLGAFAFVQMVCTTFTLTYLNLN
jgi:hypothetical protein